MLTWQLAENAPRQKRLLLKNGKHICIGYRSLHGEQWHPEGDGDAFTFSKPTHYMLCSALADAPCEDPFIVSTPHKDVELLVTVSQQEKAALVQKLIDLEPMWLKGYYGLVIQILPESGPVGDLESIRVTLRLLVWEEK